MECETVHFGLLIVCEQLTDVFHGLLDILHVRGEDINADQHIQRMLNGLLKADWHRKVW